MAIHIQLNGEPLYINLLMVHVVLGRHQQRCVKFDVNIRRLITRYYNNRAFDLTVALMQTDLRGNINLRVHWTEQSSKAKPIAIWLLFHANKLQQVGYQITIIKWRCAKPNKRGRISVLLGTHQHALDRTRSSLDAFKKCYTRKCYTISWRSFSALHDGLVI